MRRTTTFAAAAGLGLLLAAIPGLRAEDDAPAKAGRKSGIDRANVDPNVRPQDDLFRHVNGKWLDSAEIPPDRPLDGAFIELRDRAEVDLRAIIERAADDEDAPEGSEARKVGDLYASFLDEDRANELGLDPIRDELARVASIEDKSGLVRALGELQRVGVSGLFNPGVDTDAKRSDRYIVELGQGGLGLPDESYYRDERFAPIREAYADYAARTFELAGLDDPKARAEGVLELETKLAKEHWDRVKSRDSTLTYNKKTRDELAALTPGFDWGAWADALGAPETAIAEVVVRQPTYFEAMARLLDEVPLDRWKDWLTLSVLRARAPYLHGPMVEAHFDLYGKTLTGVPENRPRWKRGVMLVESSLGEAAGKLFVAEHFPPEAKAKMEALVANLIEAYRQNIETLEWMGPETRSKALVKLGKFTPKIGYPDRWRDYSKLEVRRDDLVGNVRRAAAFETDRELGKLGKPVDRGEWFMTPQTVNAYYNPGMNEIVFPAAILRPPFFDLEAEDAVNYGGIGAVIGHEIGHGFDDQGSKYDGDGNMVDWWTEADRAEFEKRTRLLISQYDKFQPAQLPGESVNGALTIGENIGDLGGLSIALKAYQLSLKGEEAPVLDGLTGVQRVLIGWAQVWRTKFRDAELRKRLATDPHSPAEFRCNGVLRNLPEFYEAFGVKEGDGLYLPPAGRVRIW